jgi:membrane protein DedA with SNARE-associated domain
MFDLITKTISEHWALSTYFGTILTNENAILVAFSVALGKGVKMYAGVALVAWMGVFTNDIVLFVISKYGLGNFLKKKKEEKKVENIFSRVFLNNVFVSLFFIKFLFGARTILTLYIIKKNKLSFKTYLKYNLYGTIFYVAVLGTVGFFIGNSVNNLLGTYHSAAKVFTVVVFSVLIIHLLPVIFSKLKLFWEKHRNCLGKREMEVEMEIIE